jgi:hypothetical protein
MSVEPTGESTRAKATGLPQLPVWAIAFLIVAGALGGASFGSDVVERSGSLRSIVLVIAMYTGFVAIAALLGLIKKGYVGAMEWAFRVFFLMAPILCLELIAQFTGGWAGGRRTALIGALIGLVVMSLEVSLYWAVARRKAA